MGRRKQNEKRPRNSRLETLRTALHLNQSDLAKTIGTSATSMAWHCLGLIEPQNPQVAIRLGKALGGVRPEWLFEGDKKASNRIERATDELIAALREVEGRK